MSKLHTLDSGHCLGSECRPMTTKQEPMDLEILPSHFAELNMQQAMFVEIWCQNGGKGASAARDAGYLDSGGNGIYVTAWRLLRLPKIKLAIKAELRLQAEDLNWSEDRWLLAVSRLYRRAEEAEAFAPALSALKEIAVNQGYGGEAGDKPLVIQFITPEAASDDPSNAQVIDNKGTLAIEGDV